MLKFGAPFEKVLFVCTHKRSDSDSKPCCADRGGPKLRSKLKDKIKSQGKDNVVKVFTSGCLGACQQGPVALRYPDGELLLGITKDDVPEILKDLID